MDESVKSAARPAAARSLREAIRQARVEEAEQLDLAADLRDGEMARLELLMAELEDIFDELPSDDDRFNLVLVPSRPARLWIDLFTYAAIDDLSGAYLLVRNSENGRRTLFSSNNVAETADRITRYVAQEIVRRERLAGALAETAKVDLGGVERGAAKAPIGVVMAAFGIGLLTGAAGLFVAVWLSVA
ncbi:MAG: hypothetical protein R6X03_09070 [Methyloceanibacter sp.]|jgi:hypothetical protein